MAQSNASLTGVERTFSDNEIIVTKTDLKGRITYANRVFLRMAGLTEEEALGAPHSIIRHPHMPRCVFKLLWDTIEDGKEIFAFVDNRAMNGDNYWVLAHVTPSYDGAGNIVGYHSSRRTPDRTILNTVIEPLYKALHDEEQKHSSSKEGMAAGTNMLLEVLKQKGVGYDELIFSLLNK